MNTSNTTEKPVAASTSAGAAFRVKGEALVDQIRRLVHEGNVRRILVKNHQGHVVIEIPVTAGVVAAVLAPVLAAVGAIAALAGDWTIEVERIEPPADAGPVEPPADVN